MWEPQNFSSTHLWTDDYQGPGTFSITKRAMGRPHAISFNGDLCEKVVEFLIRAKDVSLDVVLKETLHSRGAPIFLTRGSNSWGWFIKATEWRKEKKNQFIVILADSDFSGWTNIAYILQSMSNAKKKLIRIPSEVKAIADPSMGREQSILHKGEGGKNKGEFMCEVWGVSID